MKHITLLLFFTAMYISNYAQEVVSTGNNLVQATALGTDTVMVTRSAGQQFAASGWKKLWWGEHYRSEWVTPVSFPVLRISVIYGGLHPTRVGGGHQTKTLRLSAPDGKEYVLRTIDKSLDVLVPDEFKGTYVNDLLNDQICTAHPYGPLAIARLADAIHLPHTNPTIYFVSDDPALAEFRTEFANRLCLLEERPSGRGWNRNPAFDSADKIVNTENLLNSVFADTKNVVDQRAYLKARLFDMLINDWDRHEDQWVWALKSSGNKNIYSPIGRDRDQAFSKTDGIGLYFLSKPWFIRPLKNFDANIKDVKGLNFAAHNLDQQFLNQLTKSEWERTIEEIQQQLTDSAIERAVNAMPQEVNRHSGNAITTRLRQRRQHLAVAGIKYYDAANQSVTITGSASDEVFNIDVNSPGAISVTGIGMSTADTFYHRIFNRHDTRQINIYGLDGNDQFHYSGHARNHFTVRVIGGNGRNEYKADSSSISGKRVKVYDSLSNGNISHRNFRVNKRWDTLYRYNRKSPAYDWYIPMIRPGYNVDDGFSLGVGLLYRKQSWGKAPFGWEQQLQVNYATATAAIGFHYAGLFKNSFGKWDLDINAYYKGPRYTFFYYGLGNETQTNGLNRRFFRVKANDLFASPGISRSWSANYLRFGLQYEAVEISKDQDRFITSPGSKADPTIFSVKHFAGVAGKWHFFNGGDLRQPKTGVNVNAGFSYLNHLDNTSKDLLKTRASAAVYYTFFRSLTFAHRTGAETNFGDVNFYHAATIGLDNNLRGFWKSRYTGKSAFYQNTELRWNLANLKGYYLRGNLGIFSFIDDGRVWIAEERSATLHVGYGGGIYFIPYRLLALNVFYATSRETSMLSLMTGFYF